MNGLDDLNFQICHIKPPIQYSIYVLFTIQIARTKMILQDVLKHPLLEIAQVPGN
jgi:hypothetical protein